MLGSLQRRLGGALRSVGLGRSSFGTLLSRETIFQLSSGSNRSGVAIVRVSGPQALDAARSVTQCASLVPRKATMCDILDGNREIIDSPAMAIAFPGPKSFTGEDVVEFHVHGNGIIVRDLLRTLGGIPGCRLAEAGEFTRRAFDNGKLDLTQVEALADILGAETEQQRKQAVQQMRGSLGKLYQGWKDELVHCLAYVEAVIDFAEDEDDIGEEQIMQHVLPRLAVLEKQLEVHLRDNRRGEIVRDGFKVAITGLPNAGKSSLLNTLAGREAAIVSNVPGTTRDVIELALNLKGYAVLLADTAGIRESADEVERLGIARAQEQVRAADLVLHVVDATTIAHDPHTVTTPMVSATSRELLVLNKADLLPPNSPLRLQDTNNKKHTSVLLSSSTQDGIEELLNRIQDVIEEVAVSPQGESEYAIISRERHRRHVADCLTSILEFHRFRKLGDIVLCAESLRLATRALGQILGHVDVEQLLDVIFRDFCVGK